MGKVYKRGRLKKNVEVEDEKIIGEFVKRIKGRFGGKLVSVVLFGSRARGTYSRSSDVDLLVVADGLPDNVQERWETLKDARLEFLLGYGAKVETLLLTRNEVLDNFNSFSPLFSSFVMGSRVFYDKGFFMKEFKNFVKSLSVTRIKYFEGGKKWDLQKISSRILQ